LLGFDCSRIEIIFELYFFLPDSSLQGLLSFNSLPKLPQMFKLIEQYSLDETAFVILEALLQF